MSTPFEATLERSYLMGEQRIMVIGNQYSGDIGQGDWVEVAQPTGAAEKGKVVSVAWGSAFHAESPPLTLILVGLNTEPKTGATIRATTVPAL